MSDLHKGAASRRTILRGASWAVPSLALAAAAPAFASSCTEVVKEYNYTGSLVTVEVPEGAAYVDYVVRGAGGGSGEPVKTGQGAETSGRIYFSSPDAPRTFGIAVGQGGEVRYDGSTARGGWGYGSGGNSTPGRRETSGTPFGGGGGGSAIVLLDSARTPLVVSGGGGGSAVSHALDGSTERVNTHTSPAYDLNFGQANAGGSGNGRVMGMAAEGSTNTGMAVRPALAANGGTGGGGGGGGAYYANNNWTKRQWNQGDAGGDHGTGTLGGGNGGNGAPRMSNNDAMRAVAGGGGGGYAGGGGGGLAGAQFKEDKRLTISAGSGAAGSSYVQSSTNGLTIENSGFAPSGLQGTTNRGHHGYIRLSWCA